MAGGILGGVAGRVAANLIDLDYKPLQIKTLAAELQDGHPALVLEIDDAETILPQLREEMIPYRAELVELLHEARYAVSKMTKS